MSYITKRFRSLLLVIYLIALCACTALAQEAVVKRNVYLRPAPSTSNQPIRKLIPPDEVDLIETSPVDGYYHVRTVEGDEEGWVWGKNIRIAIGGNVGTSDFTALTTSASAVAFSETWAKPNPDTGSFKSGGKTCGPTGSVPGNETNRRKNRVRLNPRIAVAAKPRTVSGLSTRKPIGTWLLWRNRAKVRG